MSFDPFHACLYNDKMTELKEAVVIEGYGDGPTPNPPSIIQNAVANHPGVTAGVVLASLAILSVGGLVDAHNFQQDVKHERNLKKELLIKAAAKLQIPDRDLEKLVEKAIESSPQLFVGGAFSDKDNSWLDNVVEWWNGPSSREIKHKMNERFLPALKQAINAYRKDPTYGDSWNGYTRTKLNDQQLDTAVAQANDTIDKTVKSNPFRRTY